MTDIKINTSMKLEGFYTVRRYKEDTMELVEELGPFKNDITDIGLNRLGTAAAISYGYIGSGTALPSTTDTNMGNFLKISTSGLNSTYTSNDSPPYWKQHSYTYRFSGFSSSLNITEVGVGWGTPDATNALWSRALTVDGSGNPVTITVLVGEILDVTYSVRYYQNTADSTYVVNISGVNYTINSRAARIGLSGVFQLGSMTGSFDEVFAYGGPATLGPVTGSLASVTSEERMGNAVRQPYVDGSLTNTYLSTSTISQANVGGGISGIRLGAPFGSDFMKCETQMTITPPIPKDNTKSLTMNFSVSWSRY